MSRAGDPTLHEIVVLGWYFLCAVIVVLGIGVYWNGRIR